jgi:Domain of unknown function (DUF4189)
MKFSVLRIVAIALTASGLQFTSAYVLADIASCKANCTDPTSELTCRFQCDQTYGDPSAGSGDGRPLPPSQKWAYIVYDINSGYWGSASNDSNGQAAMARARQVCRTRGGSQCEWQLSGRDGCVAVARGDNGTGLSAHRTSRSRGGREAVDRQVLQACAQSGGRNCKIAATVCSWD